MRRLARPVTFFFLSCFSTLGVWPRTLPARASEPVGQKCVSECVLRTIKDTDQYTSLATVCVSEPCVLRLTKEKYVHRKRPVKKETCITCIEIEYDSQCVSEPCMLRLVKGTFMLCGNLYVIKKPMCDLYIYEKRRVKELYIIMYQIILCIPTTRPTYIFKYFHT